MSDTLAAINARLARIETAMYEEHRRRAVRDAGSTALAAEMVGLLSMIRCDCAFCREYEAAHPQPETT